MNKLREVKDDLLKEWIEFREETTFCEMTPQDKKYVKSQLEQLDKNYMEYLDYWNEKYYRNGFADVIELLS